MNTKIVEESIYKPNGPFLNDLMSRNEDTCYLSGSMKQEAGFLTHTE